jgi:hypothetical protein
MLFYRIYMQIISLDIEIHPSFCRRIAHICRGRSKIFTSRPLDEMNVSGFYHCKCDCSAFFTSVFFKRMIYLCDLQMKQDEDDNGKRFSQYCTVEGRAAKHVCTRRVNSSPFPACFFVVFLVPSHFSYQNINLMLHYRQMNI